MSKESDYIKNWLESVFDDQKSQEPGILGHWTFLVGHWTFYIFAHT